MNTVIVLIHGYTGNSSDLWPLTDRLVGIYGSDHVKNIDLPGHDGTVPPAFDETRFIDHIFDTISDIKKQNKKLVIFGHSTGGSLALSCIKEKGIVPDCLILAGVPFRVDSGALERWRDHRKGRTSVPFTDIARMVSMINKTGRQDYRSENFQTLIIAGDDDKLVLPSDAYRWEKKFPENKARVVMATHVEHDMFNSGNSEFVLDVILREIADVNDEVAEGVSDLTAVEPEAGDFLNAFPFSIKHLYLCPSTKQVTGSDIKLNPYPSNEPVFANIEITTKCNFSCRFCARTASGAEGLNMSINDFKRILALLPHAYRITLVGLGETLMHPEVVDFIGTASSWKRRIGLVTNGSLLDRSVSKELIKAGLNSIAFSLDTADQETAAMVRKGSNVEKLLENIRSFAELAGDASQPIAKAVFTALSINNLPHFNELIDTVSTLGIDVMMLTDLNFKENADNTIWKNADDVKIKSVRSTIKKAFMKNLPVLSVHGLEEFGLRSRYKNFLLLPPDQLFNRSKKRSYCFSPWQTVPVDVNGNITMCDCQPENRVGNILSDPFTRIWAGEKMIEYRKQMLSDDPPEACSICPRF